jgi:hypothetical protein
MPTNQTPKVKRKRFLRALHRVKLARKWQTQGFQVNPWLMNLQWQLHHLRRNDKRRGIKIGPRNPSKGKKVS